ncbi:MAG: methyltransferase domain-containing protein [Verrucomicrobia bacterium]|nr:methyltransferase domain-containing protein [Verrucomicrobiota bacterium]
MNTVDEITFSLIVPTRKAVSSLQRFLESLSDTTANPQAVEIVLIVDEDDEDSVKFEFPKISLHIAKVIVKPGLTMGALNMAGYKKSKGKFIMLMNDDVIVRTQGWDKKILSVFNSFDDQIVLVHVNDTLFEEKLCTFPFVSRKFCEISEGICPEDYKRYRIDDHIYNIFNLIAVLGKCRIMYLPDVIFEHLNRSDEQSGGVHYQVNEEIHAIDTEIFDRLLPARKSIALKMMEEIEPSLNRRTKEKREKILSPISDSVSLRRPEYVKIVQDDSGLSSKNTRVTVGIVSGNIKSSYAEKCINRVKRYTENYELIIIDNNYASDFNHAREMNRILSLVRTQYLVLMDDDVFVEEGWLDGLLRCVTKDAGVVTPMHKDKEGKHSYAGIVMHSEFTGYHSHILEPLKKATRVQTICSALMLIDIPNCGHIKLDESYSKYFLDIDYGFRIWEAGYQVLCSPFSIVTHIGGATMGPETKDSLQRITELFEKQRQLFLERWVQNERYLNLVNNIWPQYPGLGMLLDVFSSKKTAPSLKLALEGYRGFNVVEYGDFYGILQTDGSFDINRIEAGGYTYAIKGKSVEEVKRGIDRAIKMQFWRKSLQLTNAITHLLSRFKTKVQARRGIESRKRPLIKEPSDGQKHFDSSEITNISEDFRGYKIFKYEHKFFCIETNKNKDWDGNFDYERFKRGAYSSVVVGHSLAEVRKEIERISNQDPAGLNNKRYLVFANSSPKELLRFIKMRYSGQKVNILSPVASGTDWGEFNAIHCSEPSLRSWINNHPAGTGLAVLELKDIQFDRIVIPWLDKDAWQDSLLESGAGNLCSEVEILTENGERHLYAGENLHRLIYNKAYLASMFERIPFPKGLNVLEVGCSDGLVCEMMLTLGAKKVTGVDVMKTVGCSFLNRGIDYYSMDASKLAFESGSFDLVYSIATLEHVADPFKVLEEILRVTRVGGFAYVQAGPLYCSPFGHHMFAYFQNYPWIHLRKSKDEIIAYAKSVGIDEKIQQDLGISCEEYVNSMMNIEHVNGLFLKEYGLDEFRKRSDLQVLKYNISYEGKELLNQEILSEIKHVTPQELIEHGFEILVRKVK